MKTYKIILSMFLFIIIAACSEAEGSVDGEFKFGNMYDVSFESGEGYTIILPIEWTGEDAAVINSFELVKDAEEKVTFEEDGIEYKFYGADSKGEGLYLEKENINGLEDINGHEVQRESKIAANIQLDEVEKDKNRSAKINFTVNDEEYQEIVEWDTFKEMSTNN